MARRGGRRNDDFLDRWTKCGLARFHRSVVDGDVQVEVDSAATARISGQTQNVIAVWRLGGNGIPYAQRRAVLWHLHQRRADRIEGIRLRGAGVEQFKLVEVGRADLPAQFHCPAHNRAVVGAAEIDQRQLLPLRAAGLWRRHNRQAQIKRLGVLPPFTGVVQPIDCGGIADRDEIPLRDVACAEFIGAQQRPTVDRNALQEAGLGRGRILFVRTNQWSARDKTGN